ncbi:MAG: hypothetical protein M3536_10475 [Actinomycetota bacterium]|nr:hypothetical protein [Actinomycetota bacterium]
MTAGDFDADAITVLDLAYGDRLVRLAVDRYVVTETQEPGAFRPKDIGHRLGQQLIDLHNEDLEDAANAREGEAL